MKYFTNVVKNKNILYIHGLNSDKNSRTGNTIKQYLQDKANVYLETFDLIHPKKCMDQINAILKNFKIDMIIASSFGAFYALCIQDSVAKVVINPCMNPVYEIPKLTQKLKEKQIDELANLKMNIPIDREQRIGTFGVFGDKDELFSYKKQFDKIYGDSCWVHGDHHLSNNTIYIALEKALNYFHDTWKLLKEELITEHYVNLFKGDNFDKWKDPVYKLLCKAYAPIGGLLGVNNADQLVQDSDMWKLDTDKGKIKAAAIYTFKRGGRKLVACGTDFTPEGKAKLYKIIQDDLAIRDGWAEVSGKMEHIYQKQAEQLDLAPVPNDIAEILMKGKRFIQKNTDGYHYTRLIAGQPHEKIIYAGIKFSKS